MKPLLLSYNGTKERRRKMVVSLKANRRRMLVLLGLIALLGVVYAVVCMRPSGQ